TMRTRFSTSYCTFVHVPAAFCPDNAAHNLDTNDNCDARSFVIHLIIESECSFSTLFKEGLMVRILAGVIAGALARRPPWVRSPSRQVLRLGHDRIRTRFGADDSARDDGGIGPLGASHWPSGRRAVATMAQPLRRKTSS